VIWLVSQALQSQPALWPLEADTEQLALPLESQVMWMVRVTVPLQVVPQPALLLPGQLVLT
jgi:hypothetical protein